MRLFENSGVMRAYRPRLAALTANAATFCDQRKIFFEDCFGATHFLLPAVNGKEFAFFTNGDDEKLQRAWARENGLKTGATLDGILLAQIEAHRTDVFYNHDPVRYASSFVKRLPACVQKPIAWRAAPSGNADFSAYDLMVCNFPSILDGFKKAGMRTAYFAPGHDPEMDAYAANTDRPIDVLFVGAYTRHHRNRAPLLEAVAKLRSRHEILFHLDSSSTMLRLAESPLGLFGPLKKYRRPADIRAVDAAPVFGRELCQALSRAKIVLNGAIDMAGKDRGNMRCWEATGCSALLLSDEGNYPKGFIDGETMVTYSSPEHAVRTIERLLTDNSERYRIARAGHAMIRTKYSKEEQWRSFQALL